MSTHTVLPDQHQLQSNSFGWFGQFFQSMAHMAPALALVAGVPFMASRAGSALPLAFVFATVMCLMLAYCLAMLTRKYFGASGYFQIHSKALGSKLGFTTSWLFFLYEPLNSLVVFMGFGILLLEPFSATYFGFTIPWWACMIVGNIFVTLMALKDIKNSIRITAVLGIVEFVIVLLLGIVLVAKADEPFHIEYFQPSMSADGTGGLLFAFIFGFLTFVGFESGLPLSEETKDAKSSTFKGLMWSVFIAGVFYTFLGYATVVGFGGGENTKEFAKSFSTAADPYGSILGPKAFGVIGHWLMFFAALNSSLACALASHNASTRVFYSLGRAHILPSWLGKVTKKKKVPMNAVLFASFITFATGALFYYFTKTGGAPMDWYGFAALMLVLPLLVIHLMTCLSVFIAYRYKESHDFHFLHHGVIPLVTGILVLLPIWGSIYYNPSKPMCYAPYITVAWFAVGLIVYLWLRKNKPKTLHALEHEMEALTHGEK